MRKIGKGKQRERERERERERCRKKKSSFPSLNLSSQSSPFCSLTHQDPLNPEFSSSLLLSVKFPAKEAIPTSSSSFVS